MPSNKVFYFENPNSSIGNTVVTISQVALNDKIASAVSGIESPTEEDMSAAKAIAIAKIMQKTLKASGLPPTTQYIEVEDDLDPVFKNARSVVDGKLVADIEKSFSIATEARRAARSREFLQVDNDNPLAVVTADGERLRDNIRQKYDVIQGQMEEARASGDLESIKSIMRTEGWIQ